MSENWLACWGNGNTGVEAGILGCYSTREEADTHVKAFLARHRDNPAVGAWVRKEE